VPDSIESPTARFERASRRLGEGLVSCRSVLDNYRALLRGTRAGANDDDAPHARDRTRQQSS